MNIGFFTDTYLPQRNGVATSVGYFVDILKKGNHKVLLFAPKIKGYEDLKSDVFRIPSIRMWPTLPDQVRLPLPLPSKTWLKIFSYKYDIIHAHGNGFFSAIGYIVAKRKKVPFILTFHTLFNRYTHYILKGKIISPKMADRGLRIFGNLCDGIITPSEKMKEELIKIGIKKPISVIPNFVDLSQFNVTKKGFLHEKYNIPKDLSLLLSVGRLAKEKNFEFVIEMFEEVAKKNKKVHLVIVGEGPQKQALQNLIQKLGLQKLVSLTGGIDTTLMPFVYADADIFVFASTSEVHPMVTIEAAASGLPLVLVSDGAYAQEIIDGKNGYFLPLKKEAFAEKILALLKASSMRKSFGEESKKIVARNVDQQKILEKLSKLYTHYIDSFDKRA